MSMSKREMERGTLRPWMATLLFGPSGCATGVLQGTDATRFIPMT